VTHYEKVTREEIARRNYTEGTTRAYLRVLHDLAGYFQQPLEDLTPDQLREYSAHLSTDRKLSGNTINQMVGALRFFYLTVLNKPWRGHELPYPKKSQRLPIIWSPEEVARLIDAAPSRFYRTILMTLYATGMRRAEVAPSATLNGAPVPRRSPSVPRYRSSLGLFGKRERNRATASAVGTCMTLLPVE
jgi:integrase/recombinase XerD